MIIVNRRTINFYIEKFEASSIPFAVGVPREMIASENAETSSFGS